MLASIGWISWNYDDVRTRTYSADEPIVGDKVFGTVLVLLTLEAAPRTIGCVMPVPAGVFLVYAFVARASRRPSRRPGRPSR